MNNRRKQLMLASAKEYCKCVVEGKTLKYNNVANPSNGTITTWENISTFTAISGHKYAICINVSREPNDYNDTDYQVYVVGFGTTYYGITQFKALIVTSDTSGTIEIASAVYDNFGGNVDFDLMVIDLTALGLNVDNENDFFATDLGKYIAKGNYLPYEPNGKFIHAQSPINFKGRNMLSLNRTQGTLSGFSNSNSRSFQSNNYYLGLSANNYYTGANAILDFEKTNTSVTFKTTNTGYGMALPILVKPNKTYRVSFDSDNDNTYRIGWYDENGNFIDFDLNYTGIFNSPKKAYWGVIVLAPSNTNLTTYSNIIFCENALYQNKYEPYCNNSVFESGLTLQKGDKYKTYSVDKVIYNQLVQNGDFVNTNNWIAQYGTLSVSNNIGTLTCNGNNPNARLEQNVSLTANHKYLICSNMRCSSTRNGVCDVGGASSTSFTLTANQWNFIAQIVTTSANYNSIMLQLTDAQSGDILDYQNYMLFDLNLLGLDNVTTIEEFYRTPLGRLIAKGYYLPYTTTNKTTKEQLVRTMKEIDLSTLTWTYVSAMTCHIAYLPSDIKANTQNAIAEKYKQFVGTGYPPLNCFRIASGTIVVKTGSSTQPSGKALFELSTPEFGGTSSYEEISITASNLTEDDYRECYITLDKEYIGCLDIAMEGILEGFAQTPYDSDFMDIPSGTYQQQRVSYEYYNGKTYIYIIDETKQSEGNSLYSYLLDNDIKIRNCVPSRMVSRRTINVESENGIDLDFTKE